MLIRVFLISFIISLPFWWGVNFFGKELENFFFWQKISKNPQILTAQLDVEKRLENLKPTRNRTVEDLEIGAKSAISVLIKKDQTSKILFEKEKDKKLPIASLSKLMTALVVLENYDLKKEIKISKEAVEQEEDFGKLIEGKIFSVEYLLYPLLMESSNDAAFALANDYDGMREEEFIELMNLTAINLGLENTHFVNSAGLDPDDSNFKNLDLRNYSTSEELAKLTAYLLKKSLIWGILSTSKFNLYGPELINTNKLLEETTDWRDRIIGGKTGYTDEAGGCFLLVLRAPKNKGYLINVILGTDDSDRFEEMKKLVDWLNLAYKW